MPLKPFLLQAEASPSLSLPLLGWCSSRRSSWWPSTGLTPVWQCLSCREWENEDARQHRMTAKWRGITTSLDYLAVLLFTQPMMLLALTAAGAQSALLSAKSTSPFQQDCSRHSQTSAWSDYQLSAIAAWASFSPGQDFVFVLAEFHTVPIIPFFQPV